MLLRQARGRLDYGWVVVLTLWLTELTSCGVRYGEPDDCTGDHDLTVMQAAARAALLLIPAQAGVWLYVVRFGLGSDTATPVRAALVAAPGGDARCLTIFVTQLEAEQHQIDYLMRHQPQRRITTLGAL